MLSLLGVIVVARDQIFVGVAVSQASTLGIALAMWASGFFLELSWLDQPPVLSLFGIIFAILATLVTSRCVKRSGRASPESVTGFVYLFAASFSLLLLSQSPHGLEEIHRLLTSTIIGATSADVWVFLVLDLVAIVMLYVWSDGLRLILMDSEVAAAHGLKVWLWNITTTALMGLAIGMAIRVSGMLYVSGCLVLPALAASRLCSELGKMFFVAPVIFLASSLPAYVLAYHYDCPPGQMVVFVMAVISGLLAIWSRARK